MLSANTMSFKTVLAKFSCASLVPTKRKVKFGLKLFDNMMLS